MLTWVSRGMAVVLFCMVSSYAAAEGTALKFNPDVGLVGEPTPAQTPSVLRVCADKDNLPYSNDRQEGFENKIADILARDLGKKLEFFFGYDRFGFIRTTLNGHLCDVVIGTVKGNDMLLTSRPYYRTSYVFVYKKSSGLNIKDWDSPDLRKVKIGAVDYAPPTRPLLDKGLLGHVVAYRMMHGPDNPPGLMMDDLVKGKIDVAILWGPIAGYFAKKDDPNGLVITPCPEYAKVNEHGREDWSIALGVRKKDKVFLAELQKALDRRHADIMKVLDDYGVPHFPTTIH